MIPLFTFRFEDYPLAVNLGPTHPEYYHQLQQLPGEYRQQFERGELVFERTPTSGNRLILVHAATHVALAKNASQVGKPRFLATSGNRLLKGQLARDELRQIQDALKSYFEDRIPSSPKVSEISLPVQVEFVFEVPKNEIDSLNHHRLLLESEFIGCLARRLPCFSSVDCVTSLITRYRRADRRVLTVNLLPTT